MDKAGVERIVHEAIGHVVNLFDTAESYGDGQSESLIGQALQGCRRQKVFIASKIFSKRIRNGKAGRNSRQNIFLSVDQSLKRLRTDCIDLYQLHHPDPQTPWKETLSTLSELVSVGNIRYIGLCNHFGWQMGYLLGQLRNRIWEPFISSQTGYNILRRPAEVEIVPFYRKFNMAMMAYEPLARGLLSGIYKPGASASSPDRAEKPIRASWKACRRH